MKIANITEAKAHLSRLVDRALLGDDVVIARAGRPLVRLVPVRPDTTPRDLSRGLWEGRVRIADDFDDLPSDVLDAFESSDVDEPPA
jgi:prevent-host-death family protein